ncbi:hypothetical protein ACP70R_035897 [Stipagrostis hirtigluma subsp. patula]
MEFRGQEPVDEMGVSSAPPPPPTLAGSSSGNHAAAAEVRYHECLRNHAAALGGHVVDGCGEFMPGAGGGDDALRCAACGCHRSFHRKDDGQRRPLLLPPPAPPPPQTQAPVTPTAPRVPLLLPPPHPYAAGAAAASYPHYAPPFPYGGTPSGSGGTTTESSSEERGPPSAAQAQGQQQHARRKRFRTKFTPEQKEQMLAFAERLGWRMQKQDEALVEQFCAQVGVRRQVFKVWMHNNKHSSSSSTTTRRQPQLPPQEQPSQQQPQQQ